MTLEPDRYSFTIYRGATFRKKLTLYSGPVDTSPVQDLTGYTGKFEIKDKPGAAGIVLLDLTTTNGGVIIGGSNGQITLLISSTDTTTLTWNSGAYRFFLTNSNSGDTDLILHGGIKVQDA